MPCVYPYGFKTPLGDMPVCLEVDHPTDKQNVDSKVAQLKTLFHTPHIRAIRSAQTNRWHIWIVIKPLPENLTRKRNQQGKEVWKTLRWTLDQGKTTDEIKGYASNHRITLYDQDRAQAWFDWYEKASPHPGVSLELFQLILMESKTMARPGSQNTESFHPHIQQVEELAKIKSPKEVAELYMTPDQAAALAPQITRARIIGFGINPRMNETTGEVFVHPEWTADLTGQLTDITTTKLQSAIIQSTKTMRGRSGPSHVKIGKDVINDAIKLYAYNKRFNPFADYLAESITKSKPFHARILETFDPLKDCLRKMFVFQNEKEVQALLPWLSTFLPYSVIQRAITAPGCKINQYPVLYSAKEGVGKTEYGQCVLPPSCEDLFTEDFDLRERKESRTRELRHSLVVELGEMAGVYTA